MVVFNTLTDSDKQAYIGQPPWRYLLALCHLLVFEFTFVNAKSQPDLVEKALQTFAQSRMLEGASWGFCLIDCETDKVVAQRNASLRLMPASTQKVFVTGIMLHDFNPLHRFNTECYLNPPTIHGDTLFGDVVILAGGDPSLGSYRQPGALSAELILPNWVNEILRKGIWYIKGSVTVLDRHFKDPLPPGSWTWEDLGNYYAPTISGITWKDNQYKLTFRTGDPSTPATLLASDPSWVKSFHINMVTSGKAGSGDEAYIHGLPLNNSRFVTGTLPPNRNGFTIRGTQPDPGYALAYDFTQILKAASIEIEGEPVAHYGYQAEAYRPMEGSALIGRNPSPPLGDLLKHMNYQSDNLYAETFLKELGKFHGTATTEGGIEAMKSYCHQLGLNTDEVIWKDGSGLSRQTLVTPHFQASFLSRISKDRSFSDLLQTLPEAGTDGTLKYLDLGGITGKLVAKSGTLTGVRAYSGYYQSASGHWYAFSFLVNNFTGSSAGMRQAMQPVFQSFDSLP